MPEDFVRFEVFASDVVEGREERYSYQLRLVEDAPKDKIQYMGAFTVADGPAVIDVPKGRWSPDWTITVEDNPAFRGQTFPLEVVFTLKDRSALMVLLDQGKIKAKKKISYRGMLNKITPLIASMAADVYIKTMWSQKKQ
jgi:ribosomal protein L30/L7E